MLKPDWMLPDVETLTEFPVAGVARQLGGLRRYAAATPDHYSVARHSLLVVALLPADDPALRMLGLVHDAHECWIGDVLRPVTKYFGLTLQEVQSEYDGYLFPLLGLDPDVESKRRVASADDAACKLEMALLGKSVSEISDAIPRNSDAAWQLAFHGNAQLDAMHWRVTFDELSKLIH